MKKRIDTVTQRLRDQDNLKQEDKGKISDGYHTFDELYEHRVLLWINFCLMNKHRCYVVEEHYDGWFLLGMNTQEGQISYHCPNKHLDLVQNIDRKHPEFDGHTSGDVIKRLEKIARYLKG